MKQLTEEQVAFRALIESVGWKPKDVWKRLKWGRSLPGKYLSGKSNPPQWRLEKLAHAVAMEKKARGTVVESSTALQQAQDLTDYVMGEAQHHSSKSTQPPWVDQTLKIGPKEARTLSDLVAAFEEPLGRSARGSFAKETIVHRQTDAESDQVDFINGDRYSGEVKSVSEKEIEFTNPIVGFKKIPRTEIQSIIIRRRPK